MNMRAQQFALALAVVGYFSVYAFVLAFPSLPPNFYTYFVVCFVVVPLVAAFPLLKSMVHSPSFIAGWSRIERWCYAVVALAVLAAITALAAVALFGFVWAPL